MVRVARLLSLAMLAACSGNKASSADETNKAAPRADATAAVAIDAAATTPPPTGEAAIRVEWKAVPTAARTSPGRTKCNTPRAPSVAPTTLWGIPDAIVLVEGAAASAREARITLAACTLTPRVAVGTTLVVESALDRPAQLALTKHGSVGDLPNLKAGEARAIQLPIAGHAVSIALEPNAIYQLALDADSEPGWIVAAPAAVTDAAGLARQRAPAGARGVTAWLPARGGQPARIARSTITIEPDAVVELAVDLGAP